MLPCWLQRSLNETLSAAACAALYHISPPSSFFVMATAAAADSPTQTEVVKTGSGLVLNKLVLCDS